METISCTSTVSHFLGSLKLFRNLQLNCKLQHPSDSQGRIHLKCKKKCWKWTPPTPHLPSHTSLVRSNYSELLNVHAQCNIRAIAKVKSTSTAWSILEMESTHSTWVLSHILGSLKLLRIAQFDCKFQHPSHTPTLNPPQRAKDSFKFKMAWTIVWTYRQWSSSEPPCICHIEVKLCVNWTNSYPNLNQFNSYLNLRGLKPYITFTKGKSQVLLTCQVCSWMFPILWRVLMNSASTPGSYTPHVSIASNYEIWDLMQQHITHTHKQPNKLPIVFAGVCLAVMICLSNCFQLSLQILAAEYIQRLADVGD